MATGTESRVIADIERRQQLGMSKYGVSVEASPLPLRAWLEHQYQELLDAAIYCKRAMEEMDKPKDYAQQLRDEGFRQWATARRESVADERQDGSVAGIEGEK